MLTKLIGLTLKQPFINTWLLKLAKRTPDDHIYSPDGSTVYMYRYWLFNQIDRKTRKRKWRLVPFSIRIHHIVMPDLDRHMHDHPFNARTWIMRGGYTEVRREQLDRHARMTAGQFLSECERHGSDDGYIGVQYHRGPGESTTLTYGNYHKISEIDDHGALTFFAFGRYQGGWGFMVDGKKVLYKDYKNYLQSEVMAQAQRDYVHEDALARVIEQLRSKPLPNKPAFGFEEDHLLDD